LLEFRYLATFLTGSASELYMAVILKACIQLQSYLLEVVFMD
jgi:hypothetical protein